jgi:hypothetical protein
LLVSEDCVEDGDELSHEGDDDDLGSLSGGGEALFCGGEGGIASGADHGGHVGDVADGLAAAGDVSLALHEAGIAIEGCDAEQGGGGAVGDLAQFRHQAEQGVAEHGPDAGDGADQGVLAGEVGVVGDSLGDGLIEAGDVVGQALDAAGGPGA